MHFIEALDIGVERGWKTVGEVLRNIKAEQVFKEDKTGDKLRKLNVEWKTVMINSLFTSDSLTEGVRRWLNETEGAVKDELGGMHDEGLGWNPHGVFCGECSNITCVGCARRQKESNDVEVD